MLAALLTTAFVTLTAKAQFGGRGGGPQVTSPEVSADRHVTFRIVAPSAQTVRLASSDMGRSGQPGAMTKSTNGTWEVTVGPVDPGFYRYNFNVDGVAVIDPRNPDTSESNGNTWSLVGVPGADYMDTKDVPHGAVAAVTYYSKSLQYFRRMRIYTPPGYEDGQGKFPVFYLLHGAGDCDDSWWTVGRAGFILDNLIAAKKAKPMIIVMPAGHTRATGGGRGAGPGGDAFSRDFNEDIMPYVESHYRVIADRADRAIAGLSMGGMQTRTISLAHLDKFSHIGLLSGGSIAPSDISDMADFKQNVKVMFVSYGSRENGATAKANVEALKQAGVNSVYYESPNSAHDWVTWRRSLLQLAPLLFQK